MISDLFPDRLPKRVGALIEKMIKRELGENETIDSGNLDVSYEYVTDDGSAPELARVRWKYPDAVRGGEIEHTISARQYHRLEGMPEGFAYNIPNVIGADIQGKVRKYFGPNAYLGVESFEIRFDYSDMAYHWKFEQDEKALNGIVSLEQWESSSGEMIIPLINKWSLSG